MHTSIHTHRFNAIRKREEEDDKFWEEIANVNVKGLSFKNEDTDEEEDGEEGKMLVKMVHPRKQANP